jgi:hypothetical protein
MGASTPGAAAMPSSWVAKAPPTDAEKLQDLRARMSQILARESAPTPMPPPEELPFDHIETPGGPLFVRRVGLGSAHRTGKGTPTLARSADAQVLALLALDPQLSSIDLTGALYLDTETTGLSGGTGTVAFLVGLAFFDDDARLVLEQLLVMNLGQEGPMLEHLARRIRAASCLVTFNGKSFDMPLLRTRFRMARIEPPPEPPHLDLLHVARRVHKGEEKGGTKLGALERRLFGFAREDDVPSGDVSACYLHFLRTGDTRGLIKVVEHNAWDVSSMASLVAFYGEPFAASDMVPRDLVNVARTLKRAKKLDQAADMASRAIASGAGAEGHVVRAGIEKARGDKARALADFEAAAASVQDASIRLELAKLYEHWKKDPHRALACVEAGTGEEPPAHQKRKARLARKASGLLFDSDGKPTCGK